MTSRIARNLLIAAAALMILSWLAPVVLGQASAHPAVVRVSVGEKRNLGKSRVRIGSGTLIAVDATRGVILTCSHIFGGGGQSITVCFPSSGCQQGTLIAKDEDWDLAAIAIAPPAETPVRLAETAPKPGAQLSSCGYGPNGQYWCNQGRALGYARTDKTTTYETLELSGYARDGDSGGPVFNASGELVAVLWGTTGRMVGGTYCGRIRKFLRGIFGGRQAAPPIAEQPQPGYGTAPALPRQPGPLVPVDPKPNETPRLPVPGLPVVQQNPDTPRWPAIQAALDRLHDRLDGLATADQATGDRFGRIEQLIGALGTGTQGAGAATGGAGMTSLIAAAVPGVLATLGITVPPAAAIWVGVWATRVFIRRRRAKRERGSAAAETGFQSKGITTLPRDETEAAQLVQLSQLEGRSPLQDALMGRLADTEFTNAIDRGGPEADLVRQLRQRLRDRLNEIAPLAVFADGDRPQEQRS